MEVFISWSGKRSKLVADLLHELIQQLLHPIVPWISDEIVPGNQWSDEIRKKLDSSTIGILCLTPENLNSSWLNFESGYLLGRHGEGGIFPIILGLNAKELKGPLAIFQVAEVDEKGILHLIQNLNMILGTLKRKDDILIDEFKKHWSDFNIKLMRGLEKIDLGTDSIDFPDLLAILKSKGFPAPKYGQTINFSEGFESFGLYESILKIAKNRIYIFGRKNRKLLDKEFGWFFEGLQKRILNGFDFRCLFLDPSAEKSVISIAHQDNDFRKQLGQSISKMKLLSSKYDFNFQLLFKTYSFHRLFSVIIVDEIVLFTPIELNSNGKAKTLTRIGFTLCTTETNQGKVLLNNFLTVWEQGDNLK